MKRSTLALLAPLLVVACAGGPAGFDEADSTESSAVQNGEQYYEEYCAGCHETGMLGAPVAGLAADWQERSQLWDAVLFDHAITGYFEMPARGGRADLPNDVVRAAAEYMLRTTFPDRPHDCNPPVCEAPENAR